MQDIFENKGVLLTFLFHSIFENQKEIESGLIDPQQKFTLRQFDTFIEYFLENGYIFISPSDIVKDLDKEKKYILITFDDGYFNNIRVLAILKKYKVPAAFYISSNHIKKSKSFWWDIVYRKRMKQGSSLKSIRYEQNALKSNTNDQIEQYLSRTFQKGHLKLISDIDRPFSPMELKEFAKEKYVHLGNHTMDHAILTNYTQGEIQRQIGGCQEYLSELTGILPNSISYPNGNFNETIIHICSKIGLSLGMTVNPGNNYLGKIDFLKLNRFILWGEEDISKQCQIIHRKS